MSHLRSHLIFALTGIREVTATDAQQPAVSTGTWAGTPLPLVARGQHRAMTPHDEHSFSKEDVDNGEALPPHALPPPGSNRLIERLQAPTVSHSKRSSATLARPRHKVPTHNEPTQSVPTSPTSPTSPTPAKSATPTLASPPRLNATHYATPHALQQRASTAPEGATHAAGREVVAMSTIPSLTPRKLFPSTSMPECTRRWQVDGSGQVVYAMGGEGLLTGGGSVPTVRPPVRLAPHGAHAMAQTDELHDVLQGALLLCSFAPLLLAPCSWLLCSLLAIHALTPHLLEPLHEQRHCIWSCSAPSRPRPYDKQRAHRLPRPPLHGVSEREWRGI